MSTITTKYAEEEVEDDDGVTIGLNEYRVVTGTFIPRPQKYIDAERELNKKWAAEDAAPIKANIFAIA